MRHTLWLVVLAGAVVLSVLASCEFTTPSPDDPSRQLSERQLESWYAGKLAESERALADAKARHGKEMAKARAAHSKELAIADADLTNAVADAGGDIEAELSRQAAERKRIESQFAAGKADIDAQRDRVGSVLTLAQGAAQSSGVPYLSMAVALAASVFGVSAGRKAAAVNAASRQIVNGIDALRADPGVGAQIRELMASAKGVMHAQLGDEAKRLIEAERLT